MDARNVKRRWRATSTYTPNYRFSDEKITKITFYFELRRKEVV